MDSYEVQSIVDDTVNDKVSSLRYDLESQINMNEREVRDYVRELNTRIDALWEELRNRE